MTKILLSWRILLLSNSVIHLVWSTVPAPVCHSTDGCGENDQGGCRLYLGGSTVEEGRLTYFSGVHWPAGTLITDNSDLLFHWIDPNMNEYSPWHNYHWIPDQIRPESLLDNYYHNLLLPTGIAAGLACGGAHGNVRFARNEHRFDNVGVHRSKDPTAGSFNYHTNVMLEILHEISVGDELLMDCYDDNSAQLDAVTIRDTKRSLAYLQQFGVCVDHLKSGPSTVPNIGRGAFVQRPITKGEVIIPTPVVVFDQSQVEIVQQQHKSSNQQFIPFFRDHGIEYTSNVTGQQLILNYCFGHPYSNVLLLPLAPNVNYINHSPDKANAFIRWSTTLEDDRSSSLKSKPVMELFESNAIIDGTMVMEYVALRNINPGEEIFIDYGQGWSEAWERHLSKWKPSEESQYVSAAEFVVQHVAEPIRTETEQKEHSYPSNLRTACYFSFEEIAWTSASVRNISFRPDLNQKHYMCLRPCTVLSRTDTRDGFQYTAMVYSMENVLEPDLCGHFPPLGVMVDQIPHEAITIVDRPYSTDANLPGAFRHYIGVPLSGVYPDHWMKIDPNPLGDFIGSPLPPGFMAPIRWKDTATIVTPWAFRIGLPQSIRTVLLEYCQRMGITDVLRHVTVEGNSLEIDQEGTLDLKGYNWFLQRPNSDWRSNLHWLSPADHPSHEHYLQALKVAGFDEVLKGIGEYLNLDALVAFHITFIGVSWSTKGFLHHDVLSSGGKTFNIIVPLILVNETGPELDISSGVSYEDGFDEEENDYRVGRYRYEYDVAAMNGDGAVHGTSAVDYRRSKQMRLAATIYVADVNPINVHGILNEYTQSFPPDDPNLLLSWAGRHWRKDDPTVALPQPVQGHILLDQIPPSEQQTILH